VDEETYAGDGFKRTDTFILAENKPRRKKKKIGQKLNAFTLGASVF
jgi:hypothetical protein